MTKENRIVKIDTSENWNKAINFVPKAGEIIIYSDLSFMKIGDGKTKINDLLFVTNYNYSIENNTLVIENY